MARCRNWVKSSSTEHNITLHGLPTPLYELRRTSRQAQHDSFLGNSAAPAAVSFRALACPERSLMGGISIWATRRLGATPISRSTIPSTCQIPPCQPWGEGCCPKSLPGQALPSARLDPPTVPSNMSTPQRVFALKGLDILAQGNALVVLHNFEPCDLLSRQAGGF